MNIGIIILVTFAGIWALSVFFGVIGGISNKFHQIPTAIDSSISKMQAEKSIEEAEAKRQKFMDDMQRKIDAQRNHRF